MLQIGPSIISHHSADQVTLSQFSARMSLAKTRRFGNMRKSAWRKLMHFSVHMNTQMDADIVRQCVEKLKGGYTDMANQPHCGRPWTASTEINRGKIDDLIRENRRVKVGKMVTELGMGQCAVHEMRRRLGNLVSALAGGGQKTMLSYQKTKGKCYLRCWRMNTVPCCAKREEQQVMLLRLSVLLVCRWTGFQRTSGYFPIHPTFRP